ncbi:MAG: GFA family protein [Candidatus Korobacteraceae bacterium]
MTVQTEGQCYCGEITYNAVARPTSFLHCHCTQCQRIHGASFVSWVGFKSDHCGIDDPANLARIISTGKANRIFCSNCGTHFCFYYDVPENKLGQQHYTFFAATTITRTTAKLSNNINPVHYRKFLHIYKETQPEWTKEFVRPQEFPRGTHQRRRRHS